MADVALISVITSGTVGVLGAVSGFYAQRVALHTEKSRRLEARREDLRSILSEAGGVAMGCNPAASSWDSRMRENAVLMDKVTADMQLHRARLGVRVGPSSRAFVTYQLLEERIHVLENALRHAPRDLTVEEWLAPAALDEVKRASGKEINDAFRAIYQEMERFFAASSTLVNPPSD
ncbi:MAG: hypothetical protein WAL63_00240 [Solirubrobacteraceae bacterium]